MLGKLANLAWREILNQRRFFTLFVLNLSLGLMGLVAVEGFRLGMQETFEQRSRSLLGADLEVEGRRRLESSKREEILSQLPDSTVVKEVYSLYNMMGFGGKTRLVNIKAYEPGFPFYGEIVPESQSQKIDDFRKDDNVVWIYPELQDQLGVTVGDSIRIGREAFRVAAIVKDDPRQGMSNFSLAPRVFLRLQDLKETGLLQKGSVVNYSSYFHFQKEFPLTEKFALSLEKLIDDPAIDVVTPKRSGERLGRIFDYLSDFLGLVSLVALFLASIGLFYLYRSYLQSKRVDMAIYRTLGLKSSQILGLYLWQLTWLGCLGAFLGFFLGIGLLEFSSMLFSEYLKVSLPWNGEMVLTVLALVLGVGVLGVWLLAIPLLVRVQGVKPLLLLQENVQGLSSLSQWKSVLYWIPWVLFYFFLSITISHSWRIGGFFFLVILGVPLVLFPLVRFGMKKLGAVAKNFPFTWKMAFLYSSRFRVASSISFLTIMLAGMLLTIIPLIQEGLVYELKGPEASRDFKRPSLFLFDIQQSQLQDLKSYVKEQGHELIGLSPMVRGRLTKVNGEEFDRQLDQEAMTREGQREKRFRNRGLNLTYRDQLNQAEVIVQGEMFESRFKGGMEDVGEVSVERRYADRLNLELGDVIEVEVLGLPVKAKITSLRRVRWTSFLPNFFLLFQPGLLDNAPKTYLAAVPKMEPQEKSDFQSAMFQEYPGISMVDTSRVVKKVLQIVDQMAKALQVMAVMSSLVGLLVLYSLCAHQMQMKTKDIVLLKAQGLEFRTLKKIFRIEFIGLISLAVTLGSVLGLVLSITVSELFFDGVWAFNFWIPFSVIGGVILVSWPIAEMAMRKTLGVPARVLLEEVAVGGI